MPTNLYGPFDNFDLETAHVLPALLRKAHAAVRSHAKELVIWGSGSPCREFLHVDDCADALVFLMKNYSDDEHVNVGFGSDISILKLAHLVAGIVGFRGEIVFDRSKPDGTPRKLMNSEKLLRMGWLPRIPLEQGIRTMYEWYLESSREETASVR